MILRGVSEIASGRRGRTWQYKWLRVLALPWAGTQSVKAVGVRARSDRDNTRVSGGSCTQLLQLPLSFSKKSRLYETVISSEVDKKSMSNI